MWKKQDNRSLQIIIIIIKNECRSNIIVDRLQGCGWHRAGGQCSPTVWPHNPATGFRPPSATVVSAEPFSHGTGTLRCLQKEMAICCVLVARPRRCLTLSNPVPWQNWMAAYLGYTLRMKMLFCDWPVMVYETHTRSRRMLVYKWTA